MNKWNLIVDVAKCTNCALCVIACKDEYVGNRHLGYAEEMPRRGHDWIRVEQTVRGNGDMIDVAYLPVMCQHCDDAPCLAAAKNGAVTKRSDGIVLIDPEKAKGQRQIVDACPYGAVVWNEEKQLPQHWIFDAHLLDSGWTEPRAAQVCATGAIRAVKLSDDEMAAKADELELEHLHPEWQTRPRVWYRNLYRYTKLFVGGSVMAEIAGETECLAGASVTLYRGGESLATALTDDFGDFKFDRLEPGDAKLTIEIVSSGFSPLSMTFELSRSVNLGALMLSRDTKS